MNSRNALCLSLIAVLSFAASVRAEPIKQHPDNPHYFLYEGRPTILITSAEHYGAVINKDFDYVAYLDALKTYGLNYTRIYPGYMIEPNNKYIKGNTLGPTPDGIILPWARSDKPGYRQGGNLFDLDRWDPAFFARLKDFIARRPSGASWSRSVSSTPNTRTRGPSRPYPTRTTFRASAIAISKTPKP